ncbi:MAG: TIGR01841 family phasin [Burkholderiales bacterium]|nr:TIGR01841 family phasin [Burkholderiales bacterium]
MNQVVEQISSTAQAQIDSFSRASEIALEGVERVAALQIQTAKSAIADAVEASRSWASVKSPQDWAAFNSNLVQPSVEKVTNYTRSLYDALATTQSELSKLVEERVAEANKAFVAGLDQVAKSGPAGSEVAVAAVKTAIAAAGTAYDNITKATRQVVDITEANIAAAGKTSKKKAA